MEKNEAIFFIMGAGCGLLTMFLIVVWAISGPERPTDFVGYEEKKK